MNNIDIVSLLPVLFIAFILLIAFLIIVKRIFVNVGAREIAIKERRYLGAKMPPGRVVATEGEVGIQADVLKPRFGLGWRFRREGSLFRLREFPICSRCRFPVTKRR